MTAKQQKAKQAAAKLAKELDIQFVAPGTGKTWPANKVKIEREERLVALMCPLDDCKETFPLKKRGDRGSANFAAYEIHLRTEHGIFLPKPADVMGY